MNATTAISPRQQFITRVMEIAEQTAGQAGQASGEAASALWKAASLWALIGCDMPLAEVDEVRRVSGLADDAAELGGYAGGRHGEELAALLETRPAVRGPRRVITANGYVEIPEGVEI
ncbi:hypothetical protein ACIRPQ_29435 [Streptomyces sp. NPDC101213]|uniref:hypothetical protein n=1 Tax=Streptomyces sp. NPDC101213 TaxID=3366130 RepID=UPI0037FA0470